MKRLSSLESLRGLLALWVLVGHVFGRAFTAEQATTIHLSLLKHEIMAVYVFIILSGFVITFLLDQENLTYRAFLARRFFRLWPLYLCVLIASAVSQSEQLSGLLALPWRTDAVTNEIATHKEAIAHFWPHFIVHLAMLQGLVPDSLLKSANYTLVGQSWSISLEWQFYFVAPVIFYAVKRRNQIVLAALSLALAVLYSISHGDVGLLINQYGYFLVGILSYFFYKRVSTSIGEAKSMSDAAVAVSLGAVYFFVAAPLPLFIWSLVLWTLVSEKTGRFGFVTRLTHRALNLGPLRKLGEISYSVYLVHVLVLDLAVSIAARLFSPLDQTTYLATVLPFTLLGTTLISVLTYRFIERPGIKFGKSLGTSPTKSMAAK